LFVAIVALNSEQGSLCSFHHLLGGATDHPPRPRLRNLRLLTVGWLSPTASTPSHYYRLQYSLVEDYSQYDCCCWRCV